MVAGEALTISRRKSGRPEAPRPLFPREAAPSDVMKTCEHPREDPPGEKHRVFVLHVEVGTMVPLVARTETEEPGLAAEASHTLGQDRAVFAPALRRENRRLGFVGQSFGHVFENRNGLRVADVSAGFARPGK